jgi:hypothetical protein
MRVDSLSLKAIRERSCKAITESATLAFSDAPNDKRQGIAGGSFRIIFDSLLIRVYFTIAGDSVLTDATCPCGAGIVSEEIRAMIPIPMRISHQVR